MSSKLKPLDLTGAVVGTTGAVDFNQFVKFSANNISEKARIRLMNESGCGLDVTFQASGNYHFLPAGAWGTFDLEANDGSITATVSYTLPNPPISLLQGTYYAPGEVVPISFTLGNSPIGVGALSVSSATNIQNDGLAPTTPIIEATPTGDASSAVKLDNAGNLILGNATHPGTFSVANATVTINSSGTLTIQGVLVENTAINMLNSAPIRWNNAALGAYQPVLYADASNIVNLRAIDANQINLVDSTGAVIGIFDTFGGGRIQATHFQLIAGSGNFQMYTGGLSRINSGSYTSSNVSHTTAHGLGTTPTNVVICGGGAVATYGSVISFDATNITTIENVAGNAMRFLAWRQ